MMSRKTGRWAAIACAMALVSLVAISPALRAAPKPGEEKSAAAGKSNDPSTAKTRTAKKPVAASDRPRMPNHFNKVASGTEREKILSLLEQYEPRIAAKRAELKALVDERDAAVFGVLTPEQREQVEAYRAKSAAQRQASLAARRKANAKEAAAAAKAAQPGK